MPCCLSGADDVQESKDLVCDATEALSLYQQAYSGLVTCETLATIGATLANNGVCPKSSQCVPTSLPTSIPFPFPTLVSPTLPLSPFSSAGTLLSLSSVSIDRCCRQAVSSEAATKAAAMMKSCSMGTKSRTISLAGHGGEAGGLLVVVPGVCGVAVYSPPLNDEGISTRGVEFTNAFQAKFGL